MLQPVGFTIIKLEVSTGEIYDVLHMTVVSYIGVGMGTNLINMIG